MESSDPVITIPLNRKKLLKMTAGAAAFVALGVLLLLMARDEAYAGKAFGLLLAGVASILFFGTVLLAVAGKLFDRRHGLIISADGIHDNSSGIAVGFVPWGDVVRLEATGGGTERFLTIVVRNPQDYVDRGWFVQRLARRANLSHTGNPVHISSDSLAADFASVVEAVESRLKWWRDATGGTSRNGFRRARAADDRKPRKRRDRAPN